MSSAPTSLLCLHLDPNNGNFWAGRAGGGPPFMVSWLLPPVSGERTWREMNRVRRAGSGSGIVLCAQEVRGWIRRPPLSQSQSEAASRSSDGPTTGVRGSPDKWGGTGLCAQLELGLPACPVSCLHVDSPRSASWVPQVGEGDLGWEVGLGDSIIFLLDLSNPCCSPILSLKIPSVRKGQL